MAEHHEGAAAPAANDLDEESHFFDFVSFYKKVEFCDRAFRLEILKEGTKEFVPRLRRRFIRSINPSQMDEKSEKIPVNSIVVAAKSAVLRAMLSNGMKESDKNAPVTIKVTEEESTAFKEMLGFLYSGNLSSRFQAPEARLRGLIDLLIVGDKFQVPSFMGPVLKCITKRERTLTDSAEILERLPEALEQCPQIKVIASEARAQILDKFKDVSATWQTSEFLKLSLGIVEFLLRSEELEADSEEEIARGVLLWAAGDREGREWNMARLVPHIRFCCVKGETLSKWLNDKAFGPEGATVIRKALEFRAFSDQKKRTVIAVPTCPRKGIRDVHLELVENVFLKDNGDRVETASALWCGRHWCLQVERKSDEDPPSVGVYLCCRNSGSGEETVGDTIKVEYSLFARTWPDGFWMLLNNKTSATFSFKNGKTFDGWGFHNALKVSWEDARRSERFKGPTGALAVKVEARRVRGSEE